MEALSVVLDVSCPSVSGLHVARSVQRYFLAFVNEQCISRLARNEAKERFRGVSYLSALPQSFFMLLGPAAVCE
jgi:hypothetical protein